MSPRQYATPNQPSEHSPSLIESIIEKKCSIIQSKMDTLFRLLKFTSPFRQKRPGRNSCRFDSSEIYGSVHDSHISDKSPCFYRQNHHRNPVHAELTFLFGSFSITALTRNKRHVFSCLKKGELNTAIVPAWSRLYRYLPSGLSPS
jgi:hypothetical protein